MWCCALCWNPTHVTCLNAKMHVIALQLERQPSELNHNLSLLHARMQIALSQVVPDSFWVAPHIFELVVTSAILSNPQALVCACQHGLVQLPDQDIYLACLLI